METLKKTNETIRLEYIFDASVIAIWEALTDLKQMKQWFFENIESFRPELGFETQFVIWNEDRKFTHLWKLTEVVPQQKITYNWKYLEYSGDSYLTFELFQMKTQVKLSVSVGIIEDFPSDIPEFSVENCIGGWNYFIGKNLKAYLDAKS